jgi:peptidoglycan/xylan/chitin deacetylase (PgdA/CDA1 family)
MTLPLSRRDFLKLSGAALLSAAFGGIRASRPSSKAPVLRHGSRHHRYLALTYDDCYLLNRLQDLEAFLDGFPDARITLFPVGTALLNNAGRDPGIWRRFIDKGHDIGYHSFDHTNLAVMSPKGILDDYQRWSEALTQVLGLMPEIRFARPPFDILSYPFETLCEARGLVATLYSTGGGGPPETVMKAIRASSNGDIVQMHIRTDDFHTTELALPYMTEAGIGAVTLSRLYDDLLREQNESEGCEVGMGSAPTRTCME